MFNFDEKQKIEINEFMYILIYCHIKEWKIYELNLSKNILLK